MTTCPWMYLRDVCVANSLPLWLTADEIILETQFRGSLWWWWWHPIPRLWWWWKAGDDEGRGSGSQKMGSGSFVLLLPVHLQHWWSNRAMHACAVCPLYYIEAEWLRLADGHLHDPIWWDWTGGRRSWLSAHKEAQGPLYVRTSLRACRWPRTKRTRCCWCCIKTGCDSVGSIVHHPRLKRADDESCSGAFSFIDSPHHHDHSWNCHLLCITTGVLVAPGGSLVGIAFAYTVPMGTSSVYQFSYLHCVRVAPLLRYWVSVLSCPARLIQEYY